MAAFVLPPSLPEPTMTFDLVVFDFFGVFCNDFVADWLAAHDLSHRAEQLVHDHVRRADLGQISFDQQCQAFGDDLAMDWREVKRGLLSFAHMDDAVVAIMQTLAPQVTTALLSNAPRGVVEDVIAAHGVTLPFDRKLISGDIGLMKPDPAIFRGILGLTGREAATAIMIDDRPVNVRAAESVGMTGIVFTGADPLGLRLSELGFTMRH